MLNTIMDVIRRTPRSQLLGDALALVFMVIVMVTIIFTLPVLFG